MKSSLALILAVLILPLAAAPRLSLSSTTVGPESKLEIIFDQAMVEDDQIGKKVQNSFVAIKPDWLVDLSWRSPNILTLIPRTPPRPGTSYEVSLSNPLTSLDGTSVPAQKLRSFVSEPLKVISTRRFGSARTGGTLLLFNDDIDPLTAAPFFQFTSPKTDDQPARTIAVRTRLATWGDLGSRYYYQPSLQERFDKVNLRYANPSPPKEQVIKHALIIEPVTPLPIANEWLLRRLAELPNAAGNATIKSVNHYRVGNVVPFTVTLSARTVADQPRTIGLAFNQALPEELTPGDFLSHLQFAQPVAELKAVFDQRRRFVTLHGDFQSRDQYTLTVRQNLTSVEQLALKSTVVKKLQFRRLAPEILLPSFDESQLSSGSRDYQIKSINNRVLRLQIKKLSSRDLIRASLGYRHYTGNGPDRERIRSRIAIPFELITGKLVADETVVIKTPLDTTHTHSFAWDKYLPKSRTTGTFFVSVSGTHADHPDLQHSHTSQVQALIQLTDIGLAWKLTEESAFLYAYSCGSGSPLAGVELSLFGEDASPYESTKTGPDGVARLPRQEKHRLLRARLGGDLMVLPFDSSLPTVSMWRFPVNYHWGQAIQDRRLVELFTDRSLYRPGESVHLKGIVRHLNQDDLHLPTSLHPRLTLTDPRRNSLLEVDLTLSTSGSFDHSVKLPAKTVGNYYFTLTWPDELKAAEESNDHRARYAARQSASFSHRIAVQEFQRNTFEVSASLSNQLDYSLDANYFQGTPVAKAKVAWFLKVRPTGFYPAPFRDFLFGDHRGYDPDYWNHYFGYTDNDNQSLKREGDYHEDGEATLDEAGHLAMDFELPELKHPAPRQVTVQTEVTDSNNRTLSSTASTTVHSSDFYLGLSRLDQISRVGEELPFQILAIGQDGKQIPSAVSATLTVEREVHTQTKSKAPNGRIVVENEASLVPVLTRQITISGDKLDLPFTPANSGKHFITLTARDDKGRLAKTVITRQVYGSEDYPWAYENGIRIKIVPEKKRYQPGETARLLVLSPIEGQALVTIEHHEVSRHFLTPLTLDNPVIEVPLTGDDAPNAFISVLVIKGAADSKRRSPEPQLRLGYCDLAVDPASSRLSVELNPTTPESRPGEIMTVSGTVTNHEAKPVSAAEVTFYAVDEGTLKVMGYPNPDPLGYFHQPRSLTIRSGTSLGNFIPESLEERYFDNKGFIIGDGGGEEYETLSGSAPNSTRLDFSPTAVWMPSLLTAPDGSFTARFKAPDTLTRYRLIAVAHHGSSHFGTGLGEAIVNKPLMLEPSPPLFAHQGDKIRPKALIQNTSDYHGTWEVRLQLDQTTGTETTLVETVNISAKGQADVFFDVIFAHTGTARWIWSAQPVSLRERELTPELKQHLSDAVESSFEVRYPMPLLREIQYTTLTQSEKTSDLLARFSPELLRGQGSIEVTFARSRLLEAGGAIDYLLRYPYGCVEQTTSSTIPWIAAKNLRHLVPGFQKKTVAEIDGAIQAGADRLLGMQTPDGGLAYWSGGRASSDWASSYAGLGLVLCREAGATIPQDSLDRLASYLSSQLRNFSRLKSDYEFENFARSLYVLGRLGKPDPGYLSKLAEKAHDLNQSTRAFLALALHAANQTIWGDVLALPPRSQEDTGYWMASRNAEAHTLLARATLRPDSPACEAALTRLLAGRSPRGHWRTTWNNAWSLLALGAYAKTHNTSSKDIHLALETNEGLVKKTIPAGQASKTISLPLTTNFKLAVRTDARTYIHSTLAARPEIAPLKPVSKKGLSITRTYHRVESDGSSTLLTEPSVGDLVKVVLTVGIPDRPLRYLAIDDPLPASFQAINTDFSSQAGRIRDHDNWRVSHRETRFDRVLFFVDSPRRSQNLVLTYHARITHPGKIYVPQTKVEEMYDPTSFALGHSADLTVR